MKAIILAAGKGVRLGELSNSLPKPMIKYKGKPILEYNVELCKEFGINDIYINVHHLPEKIISYFGNGEKWGLNIQYVKEEYLLGTSGAVRNIIKKYFSNSKEENKNFVVIYGDNFSKCNLQQFYEFSIKKDSIANIVFHYKDDTTASGVAEFNNKNQIITFIEKPKLGTTTSNWVNAGIYILNTKILQYIPEGNSDFGYDIFPNLISKNISVFGFKEFSDVIAFDTFELLNRNLNNI